MFIKIIRSQRDIVAICDSDLIGKKFEEGNLQIDVKENFYLGKEASEEEVIDTIQKMAREDATFNIVGKNSVNAALKSGLIREDGIVKIQGIPVALVLL